MEQNWCPLTYTGQQNGNQHTAPAVHAELGRNVVFSPIC